MNTSSLPRAPQVADVVCERIERLIVDGVLKTGQILRLGQIELRVEADAPAAVGAKKPVDSTMVMQRGVSLTELETGARGGFDTANTGFSKKQNKGNRIFLIAAIIVGVIIVGLVLVALMSASKPSP